MGKDVLDRLQNDLVNLEKIVNIFEAHFKDQKEPEELKQGILVADIIDAYNAQAIYWHNKYDLIDNPPKEDNPLEIRNTINEDFGPREIAALEKFKKIRVEAYEKTISIENQRVVTDYIMNHPILLKMLRGEYSLLA